MAGGLNAFGHLPTIFNWPSPLTLGRAFLGYLTDTIPGHVLCFVLFVVGFMHTVPLTAKLLLRSVIILLEELAHTVADFRALRRDVSQIRKL